MWNYTSIIKRLNKTNIADIIMMGETEAGYPVYMLHCGNGNKKVILSAGMHGDEPAGVEAILRFLEDGTAANSCIQEWYNKFQFTILPCINPSGIEQGTRENISGIDLNRKFGGKDLPEEVRILQRALEGRTFDLHIDFHEDVDGTGFYLYEVFDKNGNGIGKEIIKAMSLQYPIDLRTQIDGFPNCGGVICPPIRNTSKTGGKRIYLNRRNIPLPLYLYFHGTRHCITIESPSTFPMEDRVEGHLSALEIILSLL